MSNWYNSANIYHIYTFGQCRAVFTNDYSHTEHKLDEIENLIPHIKEMGCNTVLFSPVFKSKTHGYDTTDYYQIDNRIGTNADFAELTRKLHENGIRVILDGVFNHCGRDFFAFQDVRQNGEHSEYRDWFAGLNFWQKNQLGDNFNYDTWNGYLELVKFNLKNPAVKNHLFNAVRSWIDEFQIDGLRLDAADCLDFDFMRGLRQMTTSIKCDFWLMGEIVHGDYTKLANENMLHSVTNYELYKGLYSGHNDKNLYEIAYTLNREFNSDTGLYKNLLLNNFADNHDQNRLASIVTNPASLYTIYMLLYTVPGIPSIYYGSEYGIKGEKNNGSDKPLRPYIDLNNANYPEPKLTDFIKQLAVIRNNSKALKNGTYKQLFVTYEQQFAFERVYGNEKVVIVINTSDSIATVNLRSSGDTFYDVLNNEPVNGESLSKLTIQSHWGRILKN